MEIGKNIGVSVWDSAAMPQQLLSISDPKALILFCMYEFQYNGVGNTPGFEGLVDFANKKQIPFFIISGAHPKSRLFHDPENKRYERIQPIIYWPNFWMTKGYLEYEKFANPYDIHNIYEGTQITEYEYTFISMNYKPHVHRCVLLDMIAKNNLFDSGAISFAYEFGEHIGPKTNFYKWRHWEPRRLDLDFTSGQRFVQGKIPNEYDRSFMQIVSESNIHAYFITEKTCAPLFFNKPFLVSSIQGYHSMLKDMGFLLYDEIFDYSFDSIENIHDRNDAMLQNVTRLRSLSNSELRKLYIKIAPKILHNRHHIEDLALNSYYVPPMIQHLWNFKDPCLDPDKGIFMEVLKKIFGKN